jgi:hypothetical protein
VNLLLLAADVPGATDAELVRVGLLALALCVSLVLSSAFVVHLLCPRVPEEWSWPDDPEARARNVR